MKTQERYLWVAAFILCGFFYQSQEDTVNDLRTLITTYDLESNIQDAQITDFSDQVYTAKQLEYNRGFEAGRTQAATVLMEGGSLYNYTDGYHAAVSQFGVADPNGSELSQSTLVGMLLRTLDSKVESDREYIEVIESLSQKGE